MNYGMHIRILRKVQEEIAETLTLISQCSLDMRQVPEHWRVANVNPHCWEKGVRLTLANTDKSF